MHATTQWRQERGLTGRGATLARPDTRRVTYLPGGLPTLLRRPGYWLDEGLCAGDRDPRWVSESRVDEHCARLCAACPVADECRAYAVEAAVTGVCAGQVLILGKPATRRRLAAARRWDRP